MSHSDGGAVLAHSACDDGGQQRPHREERAPHGDQRQRVADLEPAAHLVHTCVTGRVLVPDDTMCLTSTPFRQIETALS